MFSIVPHFIPLYHIDYTIWGKEASIYSEGVQIEEEEHTEEEVYDYSPIASSTSISELNSPVLNRNIRISPPSLSPTLHANNTNTVVGVPLLSRGQQGSERDSLFSPSSDTGTIDSAFSSLLPQPSLSSNNPNSLFLQPTNSKTALDLSSSNNNQEDSTVGSTGATTNISLAQSLYSNRNSTVLVPQSNTTTTGDNSALDSSLPSLAVEALIQQEPYPLSEDNIKLPVTQVKVSLPSSEETGEDSFLTTSLFLPDSSLGDPTSSIDSGLQLSLPPLLTSDPPHLSSTEREEDQELLSITTAHIMLASPFHQNQKGGGSKISSNNRGRCARCGKLVYFAERKVALGQHWHNTCFRCTTCGRFLDPGKHCEHDGKPYCNMCYKKNFGPDGFRAGSIQPRPALPLLEPPQSREEINEIVSRIEGYNLYKEHTIDHIKYKETGERIFFEGILKLYWGLKKHIVLASGASNNYGRQNRRESSYNYVSIDDEGFDKMIAKAESDTSDSDISKRELKRYMELAQYSLGTEDLISQGLNDTSLEVLHNGDSTDGGVGTIVEESENVRDEYVIVHSEQEEDDDDYGPEERACQSLTNSPHRERSGGVILRQRSDVSDNFTHGRKGSPLSSRRRSASFRKVQKHKRQEAREEKRSKFIPPYGKSTNLRVSNIQRTTEVIEMLLQKYNVENKANEFSLMIVHDNGAMEHVEISDSPLMVRLKLGPSEDVAKIYVMEASDSANMLVSQEAAAYIRFQLPELTIFLKKFEEEEERESEKLKRRFECWKTAIRERMSDKGLPSVTT